jgi:8-amino-7-oxononanoate synthase
LGLTHHPKLLAAAAAAIQSYGFGSGASPLITGFTLEHARAESQIARWKGAEAAVILSSGYQAAHAIIQTISHLSKALTGGVGFYLDKLVHASLIDAVIASRAPYRVFPHNQLEKLARLLSTAPAAQRSVVITESIFSMDGDACDLAGLAKLKNQWPFLFILDEAHASGVYGENGSGFAAEQQLLSAVDVSIVTLSKAMGGSGAAACGSAAFREAMVNWGRAYIYSTSLPAANAAAAVAAISVMREEPQRQTRVRQIALQVRSELRTAGFTLPQGDSPIIPIIFGDAARALEASERLGQKGMLALAIRPPTVARGASRLRITLSCDHTDQELNGLIAALAETRSSTRIT